MYKILGFFALPEGTDPDEFFKYHTQVHAEDFKKAAGPELLKKVKRYTISRVIENKGDFKFFGVIEMWWDSQEDSEEYFKVSQNYKTASGKNPIDDFSSRVIPISFVALEQVEIKLKD